MRLNSSSGLPNDRQLLCNGKEQVMVSARVWEGDSQRYGRFAALPKKFAGVSHKQHGSIWKEQSSPLDVLLSSVTVLCLIGVTGAVFIHGNCG